jgi:tetratricopeptide (TPR) repeat protein
MTRTTLLALLLCAAVVPAAGKPAKTAAPADWLTRGKQAQQYGNLREALACYDSAVAVVGAPADAWYRRAVCRARLLETAGASLAADSAQQTALAAVDDLGRAVALDTGLAGAWQLRGLLRLRYLKSDGALDDINTALRLNPRFAEALRSRVEYYTVQGDRTSAIADCGALIALAPHDVKAYQMRAELYAADAQLRKAVDDLGRVLQIVAGPYSADAERTRAQTMQQRGDLYMQLGEWDKAMADHREARGGLGRDGATTLAHRWVDMGLLALKKGEAALAADLCTRALEFAPGMERAIAGRARANFALDRCELTIKDCDTLLAHNPESYLDYVMRAQALARVGLTQRARADVAAAMKYSSDGAALPDSVRRTLRDVEALVGK